MNDSGYDSLILFMESSLPTKKVAQDKGLEAKERLGSLQQRVKKSVSTKIKKLKKGIDNENSDPKLKNSLYKYLAKKIESNPNNFEKKAKKMKKSSSFTNI